MKKSLSALLLLILLPGCAETSKMSGSADNTPALFKAVHEYSNCVHDKAALLDDHITAPDAIGEQVALSCNAEFKTANAVAIQGADAEAARAFIAERERTETKTPTNVVKAMRVIQMAQNTRIGE